MNAPGDLMHDRIVLRLDCLKLHRFILLNQSVAFGVPVVFSGLCHCRMLEYSG
jgi:hypothetical protein